ncbi:MAG: hypothetical protein LUH19_07135 [Lachnospiraceae bacterium]|nr:hypothetical protein [Lachnospiraceae bacterium]
MKAKIWNRIVIGAVAAVLGAITVASYVIDPFFHYHKPLEVLEYPMQDERYQNDGITRYYDYEALITGTSMSQNFLVSEFEDLWDVTAVKTCYSGASFYELNQAIRRALSYNKNLKYVLCSLDSTVINYPADESTYTDYPDYLYDDNPWNDVYYIFNKEVMTKTVAVLNYTRAGNQTISMDEYGRWADYMSYGKEAVEATLTQMPVIEEEVVLNTEDIERIETNIRENFLKTALENPDVTFYLFLPPYSIYYWKAFYETNQVNAAIQTEQIAVDVLLEADNIHVYSFSDVLDIVENADNYTDSLHYGDWINEYIMRDIYEGNHELTKENKEEFWKNLREIYLSYDYGKVSG